MSGTFYRLDETYVKVGTQWKYLYRAVASAGCCKSSDKDPLGFLCVQSKPARLIRW
jgi:hypothetical protein